MARTLGAPALPTFLPTAPAPAEVGDAKVGPVVITVDAGDSERWRYFDFSRGSVVEDPGDEDWDLAFRRFHILANGGVGYRGQAGLLELGAIPFDSVRSVPSSGYVMNERAGDSTNVAAERWYQYSWTSHILKPRPTVFAVRTADGRYAKLELLGYYCDGAQPGCVTFRYVYQGGGGIDVATP